MDQKNIYECSRQCKECTYENKYNTGNNEFAECTSDICPFDHSKIGYVDSVGGKHTDEGNWNPLSEFCKICNTKNCENCTKWSSRQARLKNKQPKPVQKSSQSNASMWDDIFGNIEMDNNIGRIQKAAKDTAKPNSKKTETDLQTDVSKIEDLEENITKTNDSVDMNEGMVSESSQQNDKNASTVDSEAILEEKTVIVDENTDIDDNQNQENIQEHKIKEDFSKQKSVFDDDDFFLSFAKKEKKSHIDNKEKDIQKESKSVAQKEEIQIKKEDKLKTTKDDKKSLLTKNDKKLETKNETQKAKPIKPQHINKYIRESWLDKDDSPDIDENGNIVESIYKIDKDGTRRIITAFDDDRNPRYQELTYIPKPIIAQTDMQETKSEQSHTLNHDDANETERPQSSIGVLVSNNIGKPVTENIDIHPDDIDTTLFDDDKEYHGNSDIITDANVVEQEPESNENDDDISFDIDIEGSEDTDASFDDSSFENVLFDEIDDIPEPEEYKKEREEYESAGIEAEEAEDIDEEFEYADFDMQEAYKFKHKFLAPIGEPIAELRIKDNVVTLSVLGNCRITIKGRNESDGFSYRDSRKFPKYIIERTIDGSIYRDNTMEVNDETYFNVTFYKIKEGTPIPTDDKVIDVTFEDTSPDAIKKVLYDEYKKHLSKED